MKVVLYVLLVLGLVNQNNGFPEFYMKERHDNEHVKLNNRPIIGVVAQDTKSKYGRTFISSTYVKFIEQAGARVVPIRGGQSEEYYKRMVHYTNGILIPGGAQDFGKSLFGKSIKYLFEAAIATNDAGEYYPVWGTCMGFQILCYMVQGQNLLRKTNSANISWPLDFAKGYKTSRMFGSAPEEILQILSSKPVTQNQHSYSIIKKVFDSSKLTQFFNSLSTNKDRDGVEFISSVEAKKYPFYGVQWHPEKNNFNWNPNYVINHDEDAVKVGQYMANFFIKEARKSQHRFPSVSDEAKYMIENYKHVYMNDGSFFEFYFIN